VDLWYPSGRTLLNAFILLRRELHGFCHLPLAMCHRL
jgi:hypothetical protein